ncbi:hypothetical protein KFK09_010545 [Dendrobium nobile]|uniref:Uncharacterized protein n=1 Tax=Dendrobium nobile TaxID=94219 RepID=A0A8T3BD98_DENNO|nr:hypothetical protein KFK09_010545 [Dendrobium nobile]
MYYYQFHLLATKCPAVLHFVISSSLYQRIPTKWRIYKCPAVLFFLSSVLFSFFKFFFSIYALFVAFFTFFPIGFARQIQLSPALTRCRNSSDDASEFALLPQQLGCPAHLRGTLCVCASPQESRWVMGGSV